MKNHPPALLLSALVRHACAFSTTAGIIPPPPLRTDAIRLRPGSANEVLCDVLKGDDAAKHRSLVRVEGLISKRRAIGRHLVFLDIIPLALPNIGDHAIKKKTAYDDLESTAPVQAILRRDFWENADGGNITTYDAYHKIIQPGVHVRLAGHAGPSRYDNEAILFCRSAKYALANSNPQHLRNVLRFVKEGALDLEEVVDALPCIGRDDFAKALGLGEQANATNTNFGELAGELLSRFPRNYLCHPMQLTGSTNSQKVKLLPPAPVEYTKAPSFHIDQNAGKEVVSIAHVLNEQKQRNAQTLSSSNGYIPFTMTGWVQNRRRFQGSISILELVDEFSALASTAGDQSNDGDKNSERDTEAEDNAKLRELWKDRIYAVLHPDALCADDSDGSISKSASSIELSEMYGNILCSGARVILQGYLSTDSSEFWATSCRLLRSSWRLSAVRQVLDLLHEGRFAVDEAADALKFSGGYSQAEDIANGTTTVTERQWMASELTQSLQGENSRVGKITSSMLESLDSFAYARDAYPVEKVNFASKLDSTPAVTSSLQSNVSPLRTLPEGSRWQRAKKPQLKFMIDQIETVILSHPEFGQRKLKVIDIGGGRGLLSNLLAETFGSDMVEVQVVDISRSATYNGMMRARRRGLQNIKYDALDATKLDVTGVDVVVALHACGALSDVALGHAVCQGAGFVICPCCFLSNPQLRVSTPSDKNSSVEEWLKVEHEEYRQLKQLAELQGDINTASIAMHTICGLRAMAADKLWDSSRWSTAQLHTNIKTFPVGFSTRNLCLVGKFNGKK